MLPDSHFKVLKFGGALRQLFRYVPEGVHVKIIVSRSGEEWEVTQLGKRQTKRPAVHVDAVVT